MKSLISDPNHIPQKKNKVIKELPDGKLIPKAVQKMAGRGFILIKDDDLHNHLVNAMERADNNEGPLIEENEYEVYWLGTAVLLYDNETKKIWVTKDSDPITLTPEYWENLAKDGRTIKDIK